MEFDLPEGLKLVHEMRIPVRWGDLDAMGHVNNTIYFRYFEIAAHRLAAQLPRRAQPRGRRPGDGQRLLQLHPPDRVPGRDRRAALRDAPKPGAKSLDTYFTLSMADAPDVVSANGGATLVWLDLPNKKTVALPDDLRAACS